jgi:uncharacterized membrane protein YdjX (TVP38/TMEM64 family)
MGRFKNIYATYMQMAYDFSDSDNVAEYILGTWLYLFVFFALFLTVPLWILPYIIIKSRTREARDGKD